MDKDTDRLKKITDSLSKQNITFERIPGVPGKDVKYDDRLTDFCNKFCGDSPKGCALSHRNIWDISHERGYENILIFEDDADIPDDLFLQLQKVWEKRPYDYDIISLGVDCFGREKNTVSSKLQDLFGFQPKKYNHEFISIHGITHTHAMIISKFGIEKLRSHKINGHIDFEITTWSLSNDIKLYAFDTINILQNEEEFGSNNSIKTKYPRVADSLFKMIHFSNSHRMDYIANLSMFKIGLLKITNILIVLFFITLFVPTIYKYAVLAYLIAELILTPSLSEASPYFTVWTAAFLISYPFYGNNFKNIMRFAGKLIKAATR